MSMITSSLRRAWGDISGFITVILVMLLAYSIAVSGSFGQISGPASMKPGLLGGMEWTVRVGEMLGT
jgi:hypothetical protein